MEVSERNGRRRIIEEITKRWISKNQEVFQTFAAEVKQMRQHKPYENQMHLYKATIPAALMRQLDFALGEVRLFDPEGELKWFVEQFPEFNIPYDRTQNVR